MSINLATVEMTCSPLDGLLVRQFTTIMTGHVSRPTFGRSRWPLQAEALAGNRQLVPRYHLSRSQWAAKESLPKAVAKSQV